MVVLLKWTTSDTIVPANTNFTFVFSPSIMHLDPSECFETSEAASHEARVVTSIGSSLSEDIALKTAYSICNIDIT